MHESYSCYPGCPWCYSNIRGRTNRRGHVCYRPEDKSRLLYVWETDDMKKPQRNGADMDDGVPENVGPLEPYDELWDMLTIDKYDDGSSRKRATLTIFTEGPTVRLTLNDRDTDRVAFAAGETLADALAVINRQIATDRVPWRKSAAKGGRKP